MTFVLIYLVGHNGLIMMNDDDHIFHEIVVEVVLLVMEENTFYQHDREVQHCNAFVHVY